jgi:hypothetical protein
LEAFPSTTTFFTLSQYPDAPNLFVRRPPRRSLLQEFRRTWPIATVGLLMVVGSMGAIFWNEVSLSALLALDLAAV